jgi:hypothetical protein
MKDVVHADGWWQGARRAGLPAQTKGGNLRMARGIRDPAMDTVVVILCYPYGMQACGYFRHLCARHLAACGAKKALNLALVLRVLGWGIIHGQLDHRTDTTKLTAGKLTAAVVHESLWDAIRQDGGLQDFHYLSDRLPLR